MSQRGTNVPRNEPEFRLDIDLKCDGLTDAQIAVLEHVAYKAAFDSVKRSIGDLSQCANVPQPAKPPHYLKGYRRKAARLGISLVEYERRYLQPS